MNLVIYAYDCALEYYNDKDFQHVLRVVRLIEYNDMISNEMKEYCFALALMHDLVEDTDFKIQELSQLHIDQRFIDCLKLLTKPIQQNYNEYITNIRANYKEYPEAYYVKMADLKDHLLQTDTLTDNLAKKYLRALPFII